MNLFRRKKNKSEDEPLVSVLDVESQTVSRIPARELAPGMVQARIQGIEDVVWVDASQLQQGELKHPPFDEEIRLLLQEIQQAVEEFYPLSLEEWEDGFRRDTNPTSEIAIWLHLARTYKAVLATRQWNVIERREIFQILIACLNSPQEHVLKTCSIENLSEQDATQVIKAFFNTN